MAIIVGRSSSPIGITVVAVLVALSGAAAILEGGQLMVSGQPAPGLLHVGVGLLLCHRADLIHRHARGAYLITVILLSLRALLAVASLLSDFLVFESTFGLMLTLAALAYLVQPDVRARFSNRGR
ncbi:MAG: hypothetical protein ACRDIY_23565 [Chloroflexota bacterium]